MISRGEEYNKEGVISHVRNETALPPLPLRPKRMCRLDERRRSLFSLISSSTADIRNPPIDGGGLLAVALPVFASFD